MIDIQKLLSIILVFFVVSAIALDDATIPNNFVAGNKATAATVNENFDSLKTAHNRLVDSLEQYYCTWTEFADSTIDSLKVNNIRGNPDIDSISGEVVFDSIGGYPRMDSANIGWLNPDTMAAHILSGKLTAGSTEIEGSNFDINGADVSSATISGSLTWGAAQNFGSYLVQSTKAHFGAMAVDTIKAINSAGVTIKDDGGNLGLFVADGGNIGAGTPTPNSKLQVFDINGFSVEPNYLGHQEIPAGVNIFTTGMGISILPVETDGQGLTLNYQGSNSNYYSALEYVNPSTGVYANLVLMKSGGKVGIRQDDPQYDLDVTGDIRATDDLFVNDDATITGFLTANDSIVTGGIRATGTIKGTNISSSGYVAADGDLIAFDDIIGSDDLFLTGDADIDGNADIAGNLNFGGILNIGDAVVCTLSSNEITISATNITLDTEGSVALDTLGYINGGVDGDIAILTTANSTRDIFIDNSLGNVQVSSGSKTLTIRDMVITLVKKGPYWLEIAGW